MRTLRLYLYFTALAGLLFGVADAIRIALGGATADTLLAQGYVLLALATGLRYQSAGHVPLRASFLLLGLGGVLPMLAGFAPLGAAFSAFLFLPLRATGARIAAAAQSAPAGGSMLALGIFSAWLILTATAPGLPGYLVVWILAGLLQRMVIPPADSKLESQAPDWLSIFPPLLAGAGIGLAVLHMASFAAMFDASGTAQDLSRGLSLGVVFFAVWFTFGSGFAETRLRLPIASAICLAAAALLARFVPYAAFLAGPEGFYYWVKHPDLKERFFADDAALSEEHPLYVPLLTLALFAIPAALLALLLRNTLRRDGLGIGPQSLAPLVGGFSIALLGTSLMPASMRTDALPLVSVVLMGAASGLFFQQWIPRRWAQYLSILIVAGVLGMTLPRDSVPIMRHSLTDSFVWRAELASEELDWEAETALQQTDLFNLSRLLRRDSANMGEAQQRALLFDNRNRLSASTNSLDARRAEAILAYGLAAEPSAVCWVGVPQPQVAESLLQHGVKELTFATDPASVAEMALADYTLAKQSPLQADQALHFQRSLVHCDGPYGLVLFDSAAMWDKRHNILRAELLRQASLRLEADGTCVFLLSPEQVPPGMLPQWFAEFSAVFPQTTVLLLPDGLSRMRIAFFGRKGDAADAWPLPAAHLQPALQQFGLPVADADDLASLELHLKPNTGGNHWLFRGPFRPSDAALAPTIHHLVDGMRSIERAAAVLAELKEFEVADRPSLLGFYAAQFAAQEYSVHDTYFDNNPYATETSEAALDGLMEITLLHPDAAPVHRTWGDVGVSLVESREISWLDHYYGRLFHELGWQEPEIRLGLAHSAMEMLDFELALEHLDLILAQHPNFLPAKELKRLAEAEEQVPRDEHAGHNH